MKVSDDVKLLYKSDSIHKELIIRFPELGLTVTNAQIDEESMTLKEHILEKRNIEFVGCIASLFSVTLRDVTQDIKGKRIEAAIRAEDSAEIPLFHGIVDSAVRQTNKKFKKVTAYDDLYTKGNTDVSAWYNSLIFPVTLKDLRNSLFGYLGMAEVVTDLPNDGMTIKKEYDPKALKALNVIKALCQINGVFGIINRQGKFEYRLLPRMGNTSTYPSMTLFPSPSLYPVDPATVSGNAGTENGEIVGYYKKVDYEEYLVKPVDRLTIRQSEDESGTSTGDGTNNYIIQGNMFTYGKNSAELAAVAENIYRNVRGIYYCPFTGENNGLPYVECGDIISYYSTDDGIRDFYVFSREMKGIQALRDTCSANGEEYQREFVTDLQTQIDTVKQDIQETVDNTIKDYDFTGKFKDYTYSRGTLDRMFENLPDSGTNILSVEKLPANPDPNTLYLIQGKVVII